MTVALREFQRPVAPVPFAPEAEDVISRLTRWRRAFPSLDTLILSGTAPAAAMRRLGLTFWSAGQTAAAAEALGESVALDAGDAAAWADLGFALRACGRINEAIPAFERATQLQPATARHWLALGLAAKETGALTRAEETLEMAVTLEPELDDAHYALGLICFEARRYAEAAQRWRPLVGHGYRANGLWLGLGQCQFFLGEFGAAAQSLAAHMESAPQDVEIAKRLELVRFLDGAVHGGPEGGRKAAGGDPSDMGATARAAVPILAAYGYADTALAVARAYLDPNSTDPVQLHHMAALTAEPVSRAPKEYVAAYFDRFADTFDEQLFGVLQYCGPLKLAELVTATGAPTARTLDLGCGTGAAGPILRERAQSLAGVDLSPRMLDKARAKGIYDELAEADMVEYLAERPGAFDLIFAADSLIYLGDLRPLIDAAARALVPGGSLAVTLETTAKGAYELHPSGRFAHAPRALIAAAAPWFSLRASRRAFLRLEAHRRVYGALIVLERRA